MNTADYAPPEAVQVALFDPITFETGPPPSPVLADLRRASRERRRPCPFGGVYCVECPEHTPGATGRRWCA